MARVTNHNGDNHSTAEGFTKFSFRGSPPEQFEHRPEVGEIRTMSVTVECVASGYEQIQEGVRHKTAWRVTNATLGEAIERPADPSLFDGDDEDGANSAADYGDYQDKPTTLTAVPDDSGTPAFSG